MDPTNMDRIIGDCFEINADILYNEVNSKLPNFIKSFISKRNRKKMIRIVSKFRNSDYVLSKANIGELITYIYNNFSDMKCKFGCIIYSNVDEVGNIKAYVKMQDDITAIIDIPARDSMYTVIFNDTSIASRYNGNICCTDKLETNRTTIVPYVSSLNKLLKDTICDYIIDSINLYIRKDN